MKTEECKKCKGTGWFYYYNQKPVIQPYEPARDQYPCPICYGSGRVKSISQG